MTKPEYDSAACVALCVGGPLDGGTVQIPLPLDPYPAFRGATVAVVLEDETFVYALAPLSAPPFQVFQFQGKALEWTTSDDLGGR